MAPSEEGVGLNVYTVCETSYPMGIGGLLNGGRAARLGSWPLATNR
jgi:hypothetical protein